jgi:hypothetical protein
MKEVQKIGLYCGMVFGVENFEKLAGLFAADKPGNLIPKDNLGDFLGFACAQAHSMFFDHDANIVSKQLSADILGEEREAKMKMFKKTFEDGICKAVCDEFERRLVLNANWK